MVIVEERVKLQLGARQHGGCCQEVTCRICIKVRQASGSSEEDQIPQAGMLKGVV